MTRKHFKMKVTKVLNEAGHFALVELQKGWGIQSGGVRVHNGSANRVGTEHNLTLFNSLETAQEKFDSMERSLLAEFAKWGTN